MEVSYHIVQKNDICIYMTKRKDSPMVKNSNKI